MLAPPEPPPQAPHPRHHRLMRVDLAPDVVADVRPQSLHDPLHGGIDRTVDVRRQLG